MRIVRQEVKTIYNIEFDVNDFKDIFIKAKDDFLDGAFDGADLESTTIGNIVKEFKRLENQNTNANSIRYIVRKLGFAGVINFGYMKKKGPSNVYCLSVFNYGDDINIYGGGVERE